MPIMSQKYWQDILRVSTQYSGNRTAVTAVEVRTFALPIFDNLVKLRVAVLVRNMQASVIDKLFIVSSKSTAISSKPEGSLIKLNTIEESINLAFLSCFPLALSNSTNSLGFVLYLLCLDWKSDPIVHVI